MAVAYGRDFAALPQPLAGVLVAAGIMALATPAAMSLQAKGAMWLGFAFNVVWAVLILGSFRLYLINWGAWGLALAYAFSYLCLTLLSFWYVCKAGYYPWRLGVRTYLACLTLLIFALAPLYLTPTSRLYCSPLALALSLLVTWVLLPKKFSGLLGRTAVALLRGLNV
jgi:hypothetical protein